MTVEIRNAPQPTIERISALVNRIKTGDIKIPKFQRGFIWKEEQILKLLESIHEGYPIGSLLFWLTEQKMKSEKEIGGFDLPPTPDKYPRNYILDGQQRLTSIYGVLNWQDTKKPHKLNVYYDLGKKNFYHYEENENEKAVPLSILLDTEKFLIFFDKIKQLPDSISLQNELTSLYETFREYLIPVVTIKEKTIEEVCPIFERINSTGTHLNIFDLMVAATYSEDFDLNETVKEIKDSTKLKDFGNISNPSFLKLMARIQGLGSKRENVFRLRDEKSDILKTLSDQVKECTERAIDFLATDLHVPSDAFLPYENQLLVIAYFFSKIKSPSNNHLKALRRWFWQTGFSEHFRGAADTILEGDFNNIDKFIESGEDELLRIKALIVDNDLLKRQFIKRSAFTKTFVVMLANNSPKNITNGEKIDVTQALSIFNQKEFHHIYPQEFLKGKGIEATERNIICNVCMLSSYQNKIVANADPKEYFRKCLDNLGEEANDVLKSNLLPPKKDMEFENYKSFLQDRARILVSEINKLCG